MLDSEEESNNKLGDRPIAIIQNEEPKEKRQKPDNRISTICGAISSGPIYK